MNDSKYAVVMVVMNSCLEHIGMELVGVADSRNEAEILIIQEILSLTRQEAKCELERIHQEDDEILVIHTGEAGTSSRMHWHIYCLKNSKLVNIPNYIDAEGGN